VIIDAVGRRKSAKALVRAADALTPGGKSISIDDDFPKLRADDLLLLKRLAESEEMTPVIEQGHKRGNVIVTVDHSFFGS